MFFLLFWCADIKNNLKKLKIIILMYFQIKNTLKNNYYHILDHWVKASYKCIFNK